MFTEDYCYLAPDAAEALLRFEPLSIGFDYYSLDSASGDGFSSHLAVAKRGPPVFVCLNLLDVKHGRYFFSAFPLKVPGLEGCPVRAVLLPA